MKNTIEFTKYNANGNDFVVIDNRSGELRAEDKSLWARVCHNKEGVGADGVLLLENSTQADFKMRYINKDGGEVEMCGNGARSITAFAHIVLETKKQTFHFETANGIYECSVDEKWGYKLKMTELYDEGLIDLSDIAQLIAAQGSLYVNTGVPHCVFEITDLKNFNVYFHGSNIRHDKRFLKGSNANFYEIIKAGELSLRTYERGVEDETLSCGTGCVATAIAYARKYNIKNEVIIHTRGGDFAVKFNNDLSEIYLCGRAQKTFTGIMEI